MASGSTVTTRRADEKLRNILLIGQCSHQILGAKLPSNRQILQLFFYNVRFVKLNARESAKLAIDAALIFWQQARVKVPIIPRTLKCYKINKWNHVNQFVITRSALLQLIKHKNTRNSVLTVFILLNTMC